MNLASPGKLQLSVMATNIPHFFLRIVYQHFGSIGWCSGNLKGAEELLCARSLLSRYYAYLRTIL